MTNLHIRDVKKSFTAQPMLQGSIFRPDVDSLVLYHSQVPSGGDDWESRIIF